MEYTIKNILKLLKSNKITITKLVENLYQDLKKYDDLNGFVTKTEKEALVNAKLLDKLDSKERNLIFGLPYVAKDLIVTKDIKTTACSDILADFIPPYDAKVIETLKNKNAILLGKATTDELGMGGTGLSAFNSTFKVHNPWNKDYITGGSSSGSAALVGTGLIPFALGTDTGDSIRKPASFCGTVGFKPTYGSISRVGLIPYSPSFDTIGYFTRNIEDCALMFQEILDFDHNDFSMQKNHYDVKTLSSNVKGMKIAYISEIYKHLNPEIKNKFDHLCQELEKQGATVKPISFDLELLRILGTVYYTITCVEAISSQSCLTGICYGKQEDGKDWIDSVIKTRTKNLGNTIQFRYIIGQYSSSKQHQNELFVRAKKIRRLVFNEITKIFNKFDILIGPAVNNKTQKISDIQPKVVRINSDFTEDFLLLANFSGVPSLTLPLAFWKDDKMPYGININADHFNESKLFNLGLAIENITGLKNLNPRNTEDQK